MLYFKIFFWIETSLHSVRKIMTVGQQPSRQDSVVVSYETTNHDIACSIHRGRPWQMKINYIQGLTPESLFPALWLLYDTI